MRVEHFHRHHAGHHQPQHHRDNRRRDAPSASRSPPTTPSLSRETRAHYQGQSTRRDHSPAAASSAVAAPAQSVTPWWYPNTWVCSDTACGTSNTLVTRASGGSAVMTVAPCSSCGADFPGIINWRCRCGAVNLGLDGDKCLGCGRARLALWECADCYHTNSCYSLSCSKCAREGSNQRHLDAADPVNGGEDRAHAVATPLAVRNGTAIRCGNCCAVVGSNPAITRCPLCLGTQLQRVGPPQPTATSPPSPQQPSSSQGPAAASQVPELPTSSSPRSPSATWSCALCGFHNPTSRFCCEQCLELRDDLATSSVPEPLSSVAQAIEAAQVEDQLGKGADGSSSISHQQWCCGLCSAYNPMSAIACSICGNLQQYRSPVVQAPAEAPSQSPDDQPLPKVARDASPVNEKRLPPGHWECAQCKQANSPLVVKCIACDATRQLPAGMWQCRECLSVSKVSRSQCIGCKASRPEGIHQEAESSTLPPKGAGGPPLGDEAVQRIITECTAATAASADSRTADATQAQQAPPIAAICEEASTWQCRSCCFVNHVENATCLKCADTRPDELWRCPCTPSTFRRGDKCTACSGSRDGVWRCRVCWHPNPGAAAVCRQCGQASSTEIHTKRLCNSCRTVNDANEDFCLSCGELMLPKVWVCGNCTEVNSLTDDPRSCATCHLPRQLPTSPSFDGTSAVPDAATGGSRILSSMWRCPKCRERKSIHQRWCQTCSVPISEAAAAATVATEKSGSPKAYFPETTFWKCEDCKRTNFDFELVCRLCSSSKPGSAALGAHHVDNPTPHPMLRTSPSVLTEEERVSMLAAEVADDHDEDDQMAIEGADVDVALAEATTPLVDKAWVCSTCGERNADIEVCACCGLRQR